MAKILLNEESTTESAGIGPTLRLNEQRRKLLVLTVVVTQLTEDEFVLVAISGSKNGAEWEPTPLVSFPPVSYCSTCSILLNLAARPDIQFLRAHWHIRARSEPHATRRSLYVLAEASRACIQEEVA
jgi:hypothetical protein